MITRVEKIWVMLKVIKVILVVKENLEKEYQKEAW
jgi:hypothetical protein|nr:MAG TPA: hypothetical protein [Crassvirales sp.]